MRVTRRSTVRLLASAIAIPLYACNQNGDSSTSSLAPPTDDHKKQGAGSSSGGNTSTTSSSNTPTTSGGNTSTASSGSALTTMTLVNASASPQAGGFVTPIFGMTFKKGDIPSGQAPQFQISGINQPYSWGLQSYYSDGSLRHASFMFRCLVSIAGNGNQTINILNGGTAPAASGRTLAEVYAQNVQIGGAGVGSFGGLTGTWNAYLASDANNVEQYIYLDGDVGTCWRIKTHFAQSQGGAAHGQLECYHYVTALQDGSGGLGGFRYIARITQPYYNNDAPTKALRAFSSISWRYGAAPTVVNLVWPFGSINFNGTSGSSVFTASGTHNLYSGAQAGPTATFTNVVPGYLSSTTDSALSTSQIYFAYTYGAASNNATFRLSKYTNGSNPITSNSGSSTFVPLPTCLHFGSIWTADDQGRSNFFQGTGSMSTDNTVRTQFNQTYLHNTGAIPPWNLSVNGTAFGGTIKDIPALVQPSSTSYWSNSPKWNPVSCGPLSQALRGGPGACVDIGPLTNWHAAHFYNQSAVSDLCVRAVAFASDFDGVGSFRDVSTSNYLNVSNSSYLGMPPPSSNQQSVVENVVGMAAGFTPPSTPPQGAAGFLWGGEQDCSHKPCMAFYAFLVFGEPHFYDLMIEASTGALIEMDGAHRVQSNPSGYGIVMGYAGVGLRGCTWALRDLMLGATFAANTSPDGSQVPQYLNALAAGNTSWCNQLYSATYLGSFLNSENSWRIANGTANLDATCGGFQMSYHECVMAWYAALGDGSSLTWLNKYATWINYVLNTFGGYHLYGEYDGAVELSASGGPLAGIASAGLYGIPLQEVIGGSLSWAMTSPCFTVGTPNHGYVVTAGDKYVFGADQTGGPPGGFSNWTTYYVVNVSGNSFDLAASPGGVAITAKNSGSMNPISSAGGESTPWVLMASPPAASTGIIPNSAQGLPESYLTYRLLAWNWAQSAGATGYSSAVNDATTRLNAHFPDFASQSNWYGQGNL